MQGELPDFEDDFVEKFPDFQEDFVGKFDNKLSKFPTWLEVCKKCLYEKEGKETDAESPPLPEREFTVIYADPPWEYEFGLYGKPLDEKLAIGVEEDAEDGEALWPNPLVKTYVVPPNNANATTNPATRYTINFLSVNGLGEAIGASCARVDDAEQMIWTALD